MPRRILEMILLNSTVCIETESKRGAVTCPHFVASALDTAETPSPGFLPLPVLSPPHRTSSHWWCVLFRAERVSSSRSRGSCSQSDAAFKTTYLGTQDWRVSLVPGVFYIALISISFSQSPLEVVSNANISLMRSLRQRPSWEIRPRWHVYLLWPCRVRFKQW